MESQYHVNFCSQCGFSLIDQPTYCSRCGSKVEYDFIEGKKPLTSAAVLVPSVPRIEAQSSKVPHIKPNVSFSILSFLATVMFVFISYKVNQFMMVWSNFKWEYEHDNTILRFFVQLIKIESSLNENQLASTFEKFYIFGYLFFVTNCAKSFVSLLSTFIEKNIFPNLINVAFVIEVISMGVLLGFTPYDDFMKLMVVLAIPNIAGYWLIRGGQSQWIKRKKEINDYKE